MKKLFLPVLALLFGSTVVSAQKRELVVKKDDKSLFLDHKVVAKETFYSIGRLYNIHPRTIASYNKLNMDKGLNIDQKIRIPLTDSNFTREGNSGTPVYYKSGEKQGINKISNAYNVSADNLRRWNNLAGDEIAEGTKLIIGFLHSKEMPAITITNTGDKGETVAKTEEKPAVEEKKLEEKEEVKKPEPVTIREETPTSKEPDPGYFHTSFEKQVRVSPVKKNETVTAGIFKTSSGWEDGKYYLLIDNLQPGTIVKITNPANNSSVYAKVLGEMSGIRQNEGLDIRISNAAASVLKITETDKFIVKIAY